MNVTITQIPTYQDLFDEPTPEAKDLLHGISSEVIIKRLCLINAQLVTPRNDQVNIQQRILANLLKDQSGEFKEYITGKLYRFYEADKKQLNVFSEKVTQEYINFTLGNYTIIADYKYSQDDELRIFKAYFVFSEKLDRYHQTIGETVASAEIPESLFWQKITWPMLIDQYQFSYPIDTTYILFRIFAVFTVISNDQKLEKYINEYKKIIGVDNIFVHLVNLAKIARIAENKGDAQYLAPFNFFATDDQNIYDELTINIEKFTYSGDMDGDFIQLRSNPLYLDPYTDGLYFVFNWNYLKERLYIGILKDFYDKTSISKEPKLRKFTDVLSYVGGDVGEKHVFQSLTNSLFNSKHAIVNYDDGDQGEGIPDCYLRMGKYIFLFEVKDSLMSSRIVDASSFDALRDDVFNKFVQNNQGKPKGVGQIIEQIKGIDKKDYEFDEFTKKKIKRRNIVIYPIIVYTHSMYGAPGIRNYLNQEWKSRIPELKGLSSENIRDLTMIDLESFYRAVVLKSNFDLKKAIDRYLKSVRNRKDKWEKNKTLGYHLKMFPPFEAINSDLFTGTQRPDIKLALELIKFKG